MFFSAHTVIKMVHSTEHGPTKWNN